jgi:hypothetical protein
MCSKKGCMFSGTLIIKLETSLTCDSVSQYNEYFTCMLKSCTALDNCNIKS